MISDDEGFFASNVSKIFIGIKGDLLSPNFFITTNSNGIKHNRYKSEVPFFGERI